MAQPNHLTQNWINYGLSPVTSRKALREAVAALKTDPPGSSFGVHGVGVFHRVDTAERFYVRDGVVYRRDAATSVHLRPPKVGATLLAESVDVRLSFSHVGNFGTPWELKSTSKAGNFVVQTPSARANETWKLYVGQAEGRRCYWVAHSTLSEAQISSVDGIYASDSSTLECLRLHFNLEGVWSTSSIEAAHFEDFEVSAAVDDGSGLKTSDDASYGKEALAHVRARALNFA